MREFMNVMAVAHQVDAQDNSRVNNIMTEDGMNDDPSKLAYSGPSPDEVTLVEFARARGFCFLSRNDTVARISIDADLLMGDAKQSRSNNGHSQLTSYQNVNNISISHEDELMEFD